MSTITTATAQAVKPKTTKQVLVTNRGKELLAQYGDPEMAAKVYRHEVQGITDPDLVPAAEPTKAERKAARKAAKKAKREATVEPVAAPVEAKPDPLATLLAAGFSEADARRALKMPAAKPAAPTVEDLVNDLLVKRGFTWARGRVYVTGDVIEAQVRVMRSGNPEVVANSSNGRTVAVAIFKTETGDVAVQNLIRSES